jgi:hypothetical protein
MRRPTQGDSIPSVAYSSDPRLPLTQEAKVVGELEPPENPAARAFGRSLAPSRLGGSDSSGAGLAEQSPGSPFKIEGKKPTSLRRSIIPAPV